MKILGEGSQGKVALCNYTDEADKLFAVKVFTHSIEKEDPKERAVRLGHLQNELNILVSTTKNCLLTRFQINLILF